MGSMDKDVLVEILEMLPAGVMLAEKDGTVFFANKTAMDFLGIDETNLKVINVDGLIERDSYKKETMIRTKGSERLTIRLSRLPLGSGGFVVFLTDISEINQLQNEILKMDKLASVGELTSGIAHEIRNPLAGIKTTAQALNEELQVGDHRRAYVSRIIIEIDRLSKLLLNFFDFAKPRELSVVSCDLKKIIENAVYMVQDTARANHVEIIEFHPPKKEQIKADPHMIQQVLMNVFINAIQAMEFGGRMEVQLVDKGDRMEIMVSDTGKGISDHVKGRIFDPFFTTKPKGIGLGLSISYRIIKLHSGTITFISNPGGTTFVITLPKDPSRAR
jgi:two-component system, NtrC family, sensor histidine kinase HydH